MYFVWTVIIVIAGGIEFVTIGPLHPIRKDSEKIYGQIIVLDDYFRTFASLFVGDFPRYTTCFIIIVVASSVAA